ncbi:conserved hypothetical protein [Alkaliphilus metalliredigens QYMF]|uniref:Uncharacterized protein n=1 Tax=Alkaliphilus metalliredigens (strain QYMF) TaxID=293826 RepID=A6TSB8_ALKMQ|nr:hypothetical protein [Alkaliphilus metalliredigens]ABR49086.1 conserved hypothetical protein [Alkaliphilus metalliredigens QYMF]
MKKYYLYIVLTSPSTAVSKIIKLVKNDEYTHAAIALDKDLDRMYSFGRKYTYNPCLGRFKQENINEGIYKFHKTLPGVIMEVEVSKEEYKKANSLIDHFISNSNLYKYNYKGLFPILFSGKEPCDNRFFCSEFVYYILKESGIADLQIARNTVRPQDLLNIRSKFIYMGNLKGMSSSNINHNTNEIEIKSAGTINLTLCPSELPDRGINQPWQRKKA